MLWQERKCYCTVKIVLTSQTHWKGHGDFHGSWHWIFETCWVQSHENPDILWFPFTSWTLQYVLLWWREFDLGLWKGRPTNRTWHYFWSLVELGVLTTCGELLATQVMGGGKQQGKGKGSWVESRSWARILNCERTVCSCASLSFSRPRLPCLKCKCG